MNFSAGILAGAVLFGGTAAYGAGVLAERGSCRLLMNGKEVSSEIYQINGRSFVSLEELCKAAGWTVSTSETGDSILISSGSPLEKPAEESSNMEIRAEIIRRVNAVRTGHGLPALPTDQSLMDAAQAIASGRPTRHDTLLTSAQLWKSGYTHGALENLYAFSCPDSGKAAEKAVSGWSNSASHFQAMLSPRNDSLGIGVYVYGTTYYCILLMGCADSHNSLENMVGPGFDRLTMEQRADRILSGGQP